MKEYRTTTNLQHRSFLVNFIYTALWMLGCVIGAPLVVAKILVDRGVQIARLGVWLICLACLAVPVYVGLHMGQELAQRDTLRRQEWEPVVATLADIDTTKHGQAYWLWYKYFSPDSERPHWVKLPLKEGARKGDTITIWVSDNSSRVYLEDPSDFWPASSPGTPLMSGILGLGMGAGYLAFVLWAYAQAKNARRINRRLARQRKT